MPNFELDEKLMIQGNLPRPITPERAYLFKEAIELLSDDAKDIVRIIFDTPTELIEMAMGREKGINRNNLTKYLRHQNWPLHVILDSFKEIKSVLAGLPN